MSPGNRATIERAARNMYVIEVTAMLRVRGQKMSPHLAFDMLPYDVQAAKRAVAERVVNNPTQLTRFEGIG